MKKNKILEKLKKLKPELENDFGIIEIGLFGSYARGDYNLKSDVDIAIFKMVRKNGLIIARAKRFLEQKLKKSIDIGIYDSINPIIKNEIDKDLIKI